MIVNLSCFFLLQTLKSSLAYSPDDVAMTDHLSLFLTRGYLLSATENLAPSGIQPRPVLYRFSDNFDRRSGLVVPLVIRENTVCSFGQESPSGFLSSKRYICAISFDTTMYYDFHTTSSWLNHANLPHDQSSTNHLFCMDECSITGTHGPIHQWRNTAGNQCRRGLPET
jgi:hypothetical protein